jgi:hypothetical protein
MEALHDKWLVDIYFDAIICKSEDPFIDLLLMEILKRKIPIVRIDDLEYALPYLQSVL